MTGTEQADTPTPKDEFADKGGDKRVRTQVAQAIAKYGLTIRGYVITLMIFPPAATIIAWRMPRIPLVARIPMALLGVILPVFVTGAVAAALGFLFQLVT